MPPPDTVNTIEEWQVLDLLSALVDKSLAAYEQAEGGGGRYRLLETVRQYARARLEESGESDSVRQRHFGCFLRLAEEAGAKLRGPEQGRWFARLEAEHENLQAALDWGRGRPADLAGSDAGDPGLRLAARLRLFWERRGYAGEGRQWLEALLARGGGTPLERAEALNAAGLLAMVQADYDAARAYYDDALALFRRQGNRRGQSDAINNLGIIAFWRGDYAAARTLYEESAALDRALGDKHGLASTLANLGIVADLLADYAGAEALLTESLALRREVGDRKGLANTLLCLGNLSFSQGDNVRAGDLYEECLAVCRELGDRYGAASALNNLGSIAYRSGDLARAQRLQEEALRLKEEIGDRQGQGNSLWGLAEIARAQGRWARARRLHQEGLRLRRELDDRRGLAGSFDGLARLAAAQGRPERAARLSGAAEALRQALQLPATPHEREEADKSRDALRAALGETSCAAAWAAGEAMTLEQAVEYAQADETEAEDITPIQPHTERSQSMAEQGSLQIVQQAYAAFQRGDIAAVLESLAEDVEWIVLGPEDTLPLAGHYRGREQVAQFFRTLAANEDIELFETQEFVAQGERVVALLKIRSRVKATGRTYATDLAHVFTVQAGKVARFLEFSDTAAVVDAYRTS